jgi:GH15 family glucan-1,4-alpha-glucosidase
VSRTPIAEHAFLSDCTSAALVTRDGSIDWLCLPRFDSPSVLGRLLDDDAGHFVLRPVDAEAVAQRRYRPQSLVLETTWTCATGRVIVDDAFALGAGERGHDLGHSSPGVLLRRARGVDGTVPMRVEWAPRPEFGLIRPRLRRVDGGVRSLGGATVLTLSTGTAMDLDGSTATATVELGAGQELALAMQQSSAWAPLPPTWPGEVITDRLADTEVAWRSWSALHQRYKGPLRDMVHLSGLVLRGLTYARSGAIVAAATTSLPEGEGSGRTWDYRFTWVRDASLTMRGLWVAACPDEAGKFFAFLARAAGGEIHPGQHLQIMFGPGGEADLSERELPHLAGWRNSSPVRAGNAAWRQHQQDVYGPMLDAAWVLREYLDALDEPTRMFLVTAVEAAAAGWADADQGIWEIRGPAHRYVHSAVMCWIALDRGIRLATLIGAQDRVTRWATVRERIRDAILTEGWNSRVGAFTQSFGGDDLDAAVLLIAVSGFLPPDDKRLHSTIDAIITGLSDDQGLIYRYRSDDGLEGDEGPFLLCTFWLADALAVTGRTQEAEQVLRRAAACANDLGLLAEQVSRSGDELLGNYPQAFSHLGLVLAAEAIATAADRSGPSEFGDPGEGR